MSSPGRAWCPLIQRCKESAFEDIKEEEKDKAGGVPCH